MDFVDARIIMAAEGGQGGIEAAIRALDSH